MPKSNTEFWKRKFELNVARDQKKERLLIAEGWQVMVVWECELKDELAKTVATVFRRLQSIDKSLRKKG